MAALTGTAVPDSLPATQDALHRLAEHVLTGARVTRLETGPSGRSVQRVVVTRDGAREEYSADLVVLAAGAINSVQMLGKSDAVLIGFDAPEAPDPADLARHAMDFWLTIEGPAAAGNRVSVDRDGQITLHYKPANLETHQRLRDRFTGMLDAIQCRADVLENYSYRGGRLGISSVAHQNGTVRFGTRVLAEAAMSRS